MFNLTKFDWEVYGEASKMFGENHSESGALPWDLKINPTHLLSEDIVVATLRDEGTLIGYAVFKIYEHPHYLKKVGQQLVMFVHPDYRGFKSLKFMKQIESSLKELSIEGILQSCTSKKDLSSLFGRMGYKEVETVYFKEL